MPRRFCRLSNLILLAQMDQLEGFKKKWVHIKIFQDTQGQFLLPVKINRQVIGTFLIDTAASYTVITPNMADKLGIQLASDTPRRLVMTANGKVDVPSIKLNHLSIGCLERNNIEVLVQDLGDDPLFAGLLGMNFSKAYHLQYKIINIMLDVSQHGRI